MLRVFTDPRCLLHEAPAGFPECPARLSGVLAALDRAGLPCERPPHHPGSEQAVRALHRPAYVERFRRAAERGDGLLDSADNPLSPGTWDAAWGAVSATLHAADWALGAGGDARGRIGFAAVRPPGHHAEAALAMGFCYFGNAAVAAQYALDRGRRRVALFDFDVHHGNGTQHLFEERSDVFYLSTHQYPFYPGSGAGEERGRGAGAGYTLNVPLPAGSGDARYGEALADVILPALHAYDPDFLILSAGFDAWQADPLGGMKVSERGFHAWGRVLGEFARARDIGILGVLEGGYDLASLGGLVVAHLLGLSAQESH
jgi:acetoin utilization deacetylase AcuC-like enzyme